MATYRNPASPLPELLAPAGSPEALEAALRAGADAVYLGGSRFNARMNAHNFDRSALSEAVTEAHHVGGRIYLTLNTLLWDRELSEAVEAAYEAAVCGVDALIIADGGAAALIRRALPSLPLHASTQLSGHNAAMGSMLAPLGFSRFVIARETSLDDLRVAVRNNPLEVEVFIHGALCVSHSGQCLFSSVVGGRSGNRGECAQPCRLPYACLACKEAAPARPSERRAPSRRTDTPENYPLSLKDLSLSAHVPALIEAGVASLKIEGRMKSPGYVAGVTAIWRTLLDERRAATPAEAAALADLFSREGFTDGYQTGRIDRSMMGVRSEADKSRTAAAERAALTEKHPAHLPAAMTMTLRKGAPACLSVAAPLYRRGGVDPHIQTPATPNAGTATVTVFGDVPLCAEGNLLPLTEEAAARQLTRTGGTPYRVTHVNLDALAGDALTLPPSALNALRREAVTALDAARRAALPDPAADYTPLSSEAINRCVREALEASPPVAQPIPTASAPRHTARFRTAEQIPAEAITYFDTLYLPLGTAHPAAVPASKRGAILPPVIFDREAPAVATALEAALQAGVRHLLVGNLGHLPLVWQVLAHTGTASVFLHADHRLNPANLPAAAQLLSLGLTDLLLSPELTAPRMRDISDGLARAGAEGVTGAIVYGRLPLMLLEKCAIRAVYRDTPPTTVCREACARDAAVLRDRLGKEFPLLREDMPNGQGHRNTVYNSLPLSMSDRGEELARTRITEHHFLFSVESPRKVAAVIEAYRLGRPLDGAVRRMAR